METDIPCQAYLTNISKPLLVIVPDMNKFELLFSVREVPDETFKF